RDQRRPGSEWHHLPAFGVAAVRDAAGSGDWCTAGFIHAVARTGRAGLEAISADDLREALRFGQALAAWDCAFEGARGGMCGVSRRKCFADVRAILAGRVIDPAAGAAAPSFDDAGAFCARCGGAPTMKA